MNQEQSVSILRQLRLKATPRRLEVMHCLEGEQVYLSAEEVWHRVKPRLGSIGLPTVYRILDELAEARVITRIFGAERKQYFYMCANQEHHHHFVCDSCRRVMDFAQCGLEGVAGEIASSTGGKVLSHILQVNGLCAQCNRAETEVAS